MVSVFFAGCNTPKEQLLVFNNYYRACNLEKAAEYANGLSNINGKGNPKGDELLWTLQSASVERLKQDHQRSTELFDRSEEMLNYYDHQNETADSAVAAAVNDNVIPYTGEEYDGIMVNTYKGLDFMALGKDDLARVEFNRALDRQRRAKELFIEEINKLKEEIAKQDSKSGANSIENNVQNPQVAQQVNQAYPALSEFKAYPDFVNPFTTYIAGVYFNLAGDPSKAIDLLKESAGMVPENTYIAEDLAETDKFLTGSVQLKDTVWVIFENGLGPVKEEFRIDLPLFLVTSGVKYVGIALPRLTRGQEAYPYLIARAGGQGYQTQIVADMERVIQTEFSKDFKAILTRAIISTVGKAVAQYALQQQGGDAATLMSVAMAAYSFTTTAADVRIWTTLPKNFQVARFKMPQDRLIRITAPDGAILLDIGIPDCGNAVVYVTMPVTDGRAVYDIIKY